MAKTYSIATQITAKDAASNVIRNVQANVDNLSRATKHATKANASMWQQMKAYAGGQMLYNTVSRVANFMFDAVREAEDAVARFVPKFGGDMQKTKAFVDALNKSAAETPFQFNDLASAADTLMGFGVANAENVIKTMNMLGDVAGGNAQRMQSIVLAYSQSMAAGKANMQDINQLINAGVPILGELAKMYKVNVGVMRDMISRGKIMSTDIDKAFKRMTASGGMFFEGMKIQSKTLSGQLSTLQDNLKQAAAKAAGPIIKTFTPVIQIVGDVVSGFANMPSAIQGGLIAAGAAIAIWAGGVKGKLGGILLLIGGIKSALDSMSDTEGEMIVIDNQITKIDKMQKDLDEKNIFFNNILKQIRENTKYGKKGTDYRIILPENYSQLVGQIYKKAPEIMDIVKKQPAYREGRYNLTNVQGGILQSAINQYLFGLKENINKERLSGLKTSNSITDKHARSIWNVMYDKSTGIAAARTEADLQFKVFSMLGGGSISDLMSRISASAEDIKKQDKNPIYIKAFYDRVNELLAGLKDQKSNIDVNIRVDQEGNVTTANASAKSTGVNLRQAVRFNP